MDSDPIIAATPRAQDEPPTTGNKTPVVIALIVAALLLVGLGVYFWADTETEQVVSQPLPMPALVVEEPPEPEPVVSEPVIAEPEKTAFELPPLDASDELVRDGVVSLSRAEDINAWLSPDELVRKFVAVSDSVANGSVPRNLVRVVTPKEPFTVTMVGERADGETLYRMDPAAYGRFDNFTDVFTSIDADRAAEFYVLLKPLFEEAYVELGYTDRDFDQVVFDAIGRMLETPVLDEPPDLIQPRVMYEYADPQLEALSDAQKQLLRMGPDNSRAIQSKLREFALALRRVLEK